MKIRWCVIVLTLFVLGCATMDQVRPGDPDYRPAYPEGPSRMDVGMRGKVSGAIYSETEAVSLFETVKAKRVGDILTVVLNEITTALSESDTQVNKDMTTTLTNPTVLGQSFALDNLKRKPAFILGDGVNGGVSLNSDSEFEGESSSEQRNLLTGNITVTVAEVLRNGNLVIRGEKWVNINTSKEFIRLKGIVRPQDVSPDNMISSQKVADAQITYSGTGQNQGANVQGWLGKFFTSALWFM